MIGLLEELRRGGIQLVLRIGNWVDQVESKDTKAFVEAGVEGYCSERIVKSALSRTGGRYAQTYSKLASRPEMFLD